MYVYWHHYKERKNDWSEIRASFDGTLKENREKVKQTDDFFAKQRCTSAIGRVLQHGRKAPFDSKSRIRRNHGLNSDRKGVIYTH
jgi:hypothetical protein